MDSATDVLNKDWIFKRKDSNMSWYSRYDYWGPRASVGTKLSNGTVAAKALAKKEGRDPFPVKIEGRKIAKTFWGQRWCDNLERYQHISNRLPRGATYVRNGSVADLVISPGEVRAIVAGTEAYTVKIKIQTLGPDTWKAIASECAQEIHSLFDLLQGRFSDAIMKRLTQVEGGLFPKNTEIQMNCSCPDSTTVCKHVAAVFYGIAARLDQQPELLFKLRNVDHLELIGQAATAANLDRALENTDDSTLSNGDLSDIFGIDIESSPTESSATTPTSKKPNKKRSTSTKVAVVTAEVAAPVTPRRGRPKKVELVVSPARTKRPAKATTTSKSKILPAEFIIGESTTTKTTRRKTVKSIKPETKKVGNKNKKLIAKKTASLTTATKARKRPR
jgi:uncharacterized Zn finger protein